MPKISYEDLSQKDKKDYLNKLGVLYGDAECIPILSKKQSLPKKKKSNLEQQLQIKLVTWAKLRGLPLISIPNHGKRSHWNGMKEVQAGLTKGVSDLFLCRPVKSYSGFWLELKAPHRTPSVDQYEWLERMRKEGYRADWYDNFDLAVAAIEDYLKEGR